MTKKILISLSVIAAVAALAIGATTAYFSDVETSTGNTFTAGTLDLELIPENPASLPFALANMKPGEGRMVKIDLKNAGSIFGDAYLHFKDIVDDPGVETEPEGISTVYDISKKINVKVWYEGTEIFLAHSERKPTDTDGDGKVDLAELNSHKFNLGGLPAGVTGNLDIIFELENVGNEYQGDKTTFTMEFILEQG